MMLAPTVWVCPNCDCRDATAGNVPNRFHTCRNGITAPLVPEGLACKVEAIEREDYVGDDLAQYDNAGRAIMSVITTRDDGTDCAVLAPTATGKME